MSNIQKIQDSIFWVGTHDRRLELFENIFPIPEGVTYNSYVIIDEKTALLDTVDNATALEYLSNVKEALNGRTLDYLIIHHMEPDHCGMIPDIIKTYPQVKIVGNKKTFQYMESFYNLNVQDHYFEVKEGDTLSLGSKKLTFAFMPMVHWPEVMVSYESQTKTLFSADAFGAFGTLDGNIFADQIDLPNRFDSQARRYYSNIVGFYGKQAQNAIKKLSTLDIKVIAPLHGPIWRENLEYVLNKYELWTTYTPEKKGALILYGTMYGNTESAANLLASHLSANNVKDIRIMDVSKNDHSYIVGEIWKYSNIIFMAPTYNTMLYPKMSFLLDKLRFVKFQNRHVSLVGNYTWASAALDVLKNQLSGFDNISFIGDSIDIQSSLNEKNRKEIEKLATDIAQDILN